MAFRFPRVKGRIRPVPGQMNKMEQDYAQELELLKRGGAIVQYWWPCIKLQLAPKTFYTGDFLVHNAITHELEIHETKGHWEDDARVKIKVAADKYPCFRFFAITRVKGRWNTEEIG